MVNCRCYTKRALLQQDAIGYAYKLRTTYSDPIIVLNAEETQEFEVIIVTTYCEAHSIMVLLPEFFPNVVHTL